MDIKAEWQRKKKHTDMKQGRSRRGMQPERRSEIEKTQLARKKQQTIEVLPRQSASRQYHQFHVVLKDIIIE